jgi:hypothetical protein
MSMRPASAGFMVTDRAEGVVVGVVEANSGDCCPTEETAPGAPPQAEISTAEPTVTSSPITGRRLTSP